MASGSSLRPRRRSTRTPPKASPATVAKASRNPVSSPSAPSGLPVGSGAIRPSALFRCPWSAGVSGASSGTALDVLHPPYGGVFGNDNANSIVLKVESLPTAEKTMYQKAALYDLTTESTPTSFTVRRNYVLGAIVFPPSEYANFRTFYSKMENKDQESVVLATATAKATPTGN